MKDCFIGYHAEIIKHISTAIALSVFKNIFHIAVYSYNLKMKTIFSYCLLNLGRAGSIHFGKMDRTVFLYCEVSVFKNVELLIYAVKDRNSRCL